MSLKKGRGPRAEGRGVGSRRFARGSAAALPSPEQVAASPLGRYRGIVDDWDAFVAALCRPLPPCVWANPSRLGAGELQGLLAEEGIVADAIPWLPGALSLPLEARPGQHWWYCAGLAHAQEAVSQVPALLMDLAPGQRVLDLCAAPGGKTAQIAFALGNRGTLIANDISTDRIKALQGNLDRLGIVNVSTTCTDGANWPAAGGTFDRILVDAPCSSEGTIRRNPSMLGRLDPQSPARLAPRQRALLRKAVQRLAPGGRILYSTCTLAPEENELVVADVLAEFGGLVRLVPANLPGLVTGPGITEWQGRSLPAELGRCLRIWPHHNDSGGFFIAVLERDPEARVPVRARARTGTRVRRPRPGGQCRVASGPRRQVRASGPGLGPLPGPSADPPGSAPDGRRSSPADRPEGRGQRALLSPHQRAATQAHHRRGHAVRAHRDPLPPGADSGPAGPLPAPARPSTPPRSSSRPIPPVRWW